MPTFIEGNLDILSRFRGGLVEQNGDLTVDVKSCFYDIGGTKGQYGGASNQSVTDDDTSYVYLDSSAVLQINTTGYPGTNHIRLAKVFAANGTITSINDERAFLTIQDADSAHSHSNKAQLDLLTDGDHDVRADNPHTVTAAQAGAAATDHDATHIRAGSDEIDGDKLDIDWNPTNYTPAITPAEVDNVDHLTAHLYGIDQELASAGGGQTDTVAGATGITNTGNNVDAVLAPTYGSSANTICQGNDSRLVTNGNSHDHSGGDGAQIDHTTLSNIGSNTHAQVDTHLAASAPHSGHAALNHDITHIRTGSDEIDGDKLDIDWNPTNYTPATTPAEVTNVDELTAHLYGIDQALGSAGGTFGSEHEEASSDGQSTTTSTTYVNKLTHTTASLPSGKYRIAYSCEVSNENDYLTSVRLTVGGTTYNEATVYAWDDTEWNTFSGFVYLTALSGAQTINIDYKTDSGTKDAYIRRARIEIWRIS